MQLKCEIKERFFKNPLGDLIGGLMAAIVALPLCLAFGVASGLGAASGLYGAIALGILAALFGGTAGQCSGPTGPMTVVAAALFSTNPSRPELVFASVIAAGAIQIAMGYAKAGQLIGYMPYPVISGFMTGIGAIIISIELAPLFGLPSSGNVLSALQSIAEIPAHANIHAALVGLLSLAIIYLLPLISKRIPASLVALAVATWISLSFKIDLPRIGEIPSSLPVPGLPSISITDLHIVLQNGLTLAVLGSIDSLLTSLVLDKVNKGRHNSDQELIGQGIGNIAAGLISGLPGAGATMRSMVNVKSGGTTALSGAIHGLILLAVLLCMSRIAALIPLASLAAILFTVGLSIMDWRILRGLHKTPKSDTFVMIVVLVLTIFVDLIVAVLVGVALASVLFVRKLADTKFSSITNLNTLEGLKDLADHIPEDVRRHTYSYVLNGPLFFGQAKNLTDAIDHLSNAKYVILRFANVPLIDQTGAFALESAIEKWDAGGTKVLFVGLQPNIIKTLEDTGAQINMENTFEQFEKAIEAIAHFEAKSTYTSSGDTNFQI